jgi:hypothetical protein
MGNAYKNEYTTKGSQLSMTQNKARKETSTSIATPDFELCIYIEN